MASKNGSKDIGAASPSLKGGKVPNGAELIAPLYSVYADKSFNVRKAVAADTAEMLGEGGSKGFNGLLVDIALRGQENPVVVRPNPNKDKVGHPAFGKDWELASGFQRWECIDKLAACGPDTLKVLTDPKNGGMTEAAAVALRSSAPTIKVKVKYLSDAEMRGENLRENLLRNSISGPDVAFGVADLRAKMPAGTSDETIARMIGKSQGYVSTLKRIVEGFRGVKVAKDTLGSHPSMGILESWRIAPKKVSAADMEAIATSDASPEEKANAYVEKARKKASGNGSETGRAMGEGAWVKNAIQDAQRIAKMLATLQNLGCAEVNEATFTADNVMLILNVLRADGEYSKKDRSAEELAQVAAAALSVFRANSETEENQAAVKASAKKAGKSNGKHATA